MTNGKGDAPRPRRVSGEQMDINWSLAMGKQDRDEKRRLAFLSDIMGVYDRHNLALSHEDTQGAFVVAPRSRELIEWLEQARMKG